MPVIEFETKLISTHSINVPDEVSMQLHADEKVKVMIVPAGLSEEEEEMLFKKTGLTAFFNNYEDNDDFYEKKYGQQ